MQQLAARSWITAGVAVAGAGVIAVTPATVPLPRPTAHVLEIQLASGAEDITDITLDFVRHGQSVDNVQQILGTLPPGVPITDLGKEQAITVGQELYNHGDNNINGAAGVYASDFLRTQQTAWPLLQLLLGNPGDATNIPAGPTPLPDFDPGHLLSGLNEVDAGFLEGDKLTPLVEIAYGLPILAWILGLYFVPMLGATANPNGMAFEDRFSGAVQTIYGNTVASADGKLTDVAFSHAGAITAWVLMNVKNPDFGPVLKLLIDDHIPLTNTGQVVVQGNPTDGWTLISWDGTDVPQHPGLLTGLFVDWRDLITAPQMALWNLWEAIIGGDPTTIEPALQNGFDEVAAATTQFPQAVIDTITGALGDSAGAAAGAAGDALLGGALASI